MSEQESKLYALYQAVHLMMARLGADGEIDTRAPEVDAVMDAMHEYDGGQYIQWNTPQPVTPAGGEVDCGCGWGSDCEDAVIDRRLNSLHKDMRANGHNGGMVGVAWDRAVFRAGMENYPPVADAALLAVMERECWTLRCDSYPTGGGDAEVEWTVISHHMPPTYETEVATGRTPTEALTKAVAALNQRGGGCD